MKIATLIVSRNRPDLVHRQIEELSAKTQVENDIYVVECGTEFENLTEYTSLWYQDQDFKGKCFGHNVLLDYVQKLNIHYDYFLFIMNDVFFERYEHDPLLEMIDLMEQHQHIAVLSPTNVDCQYPGCLPQADSLYRPVTSADYLCLMMRHSDVQQYGFLNKDFKYCWGAIHELSHKCALDGKIVAYYDKVSYLHLGGSTYGKNTNTISREDYQRNAKQFAADYFKAQYGENWDQQFWLTSKKLSPDITINTFEQHRKYWEALS